MSAVLPYRHRRIDAKENSHSHHVLAVALRAVLQVWLDRQDQWEVATGMMCAALQRFLHAPAEQASDACGRHEAISKVVECPVRPAGMGDAVVQGTAFLNTLHQKEHTARSAPMAF